MRLLPALLVATALSWSASAQTYTISTFAGGGLPVNIPGTSPSLGPQMPQYVAADPAGNVFFVYQNIVLRLDAVTGILSLAAGNGTPGFSGDNGPAASAQLLNPQGLALDSAGNLYIADTSNNRVRKVSNGVITTVAGNGTPGFSGDNGPATSAQLHGPYGVALDPAGNLYITDLGNDRIRKVSNGVITTVAGNGTQGLSGDNGPATSAQLITPGGLAADSAGNLYIADYYRIRKVSNGVITTVAGYGTTPGFSGDNGPATSAQLDVPAGLAVDSTGALYIADLGNQRIRKIANGVITTVAGGGSGPGIGDNGPATSAQLAEPAGVAVDSSGNLYIADAFNYRIRKVSNGVIATVAGNGTPGFSGDNAPAASAQLYMPWGVAVDSAGNLYIGDTMNYRIRKVTNGVIATVAGNGTLGFSGDNGPATSTQLDFPTGVAVDSAGNLYIADTDNHRIRKVSNGVIATVAGNGKSFFSGDNGPATSAELNYPIGVAVDSSGNLYIADSQNNRIRKVSNGVITTVAGGGSSGLGDNGPATSAQLIDPRSVALDAPGNLYIADYANQRIRKVSNGVITTVAGNGTPGFAGDNGPATSAQLDYPAGVALDSAGNIYITDEGNRIRKVMNGVITTVAGNGTIGLSGDGGPATNAQLNYSFGVAVDSAGNIYIADTRNNRIRLLTLGLGSSCTYFVSANSLQAPAAGGNFTVTIQTTASCSWTISNLPAWITVSGASSGTGPATVILVAAPNSGAPLSATVSIAGGSLTITQTGQSSACTYSISPGGQTFAAAGGSGTINITAGPACPWTAASTATWVTITGVAAGSGNGSVTYQAVANTGAARSGVVTIAGLAFTVEEGSASVAGFTNAGSMAQLASAGYWTTTITLVNTGSTAALVRLNFFDNNGNPLLLPLTFPQLPFPQSTPTAGPLLAATLDRTLNPGAELVILTTGPSTQTTQVGWAQLLTNGAIGGFAVFSQAIGGGDQEAAVPLETRNASTYILSFDNSNGADTGIALANLSAQALNAAITISDDTGALILSDIIALPAMGHTSIDMATRYGSSTAGRRGTLQFTTPSPGQISVLGLRFTPTGAFTTIPPLAK